MSLLGPSCLSNGIQVLSAILRLYLEKQMKQASDCPQKNGQSDGHPESNLMHFSLKMWHLVVVILVIFLIINWQNVVYLLVKNEFLFSLKFLQSIALRCPYRMDTYRHNRRVCMHFFLRLTPVALGGGRRSHSTYRIAERSSVFGDLEHDASLPHPAGRYQTHSVRGK